MTKENISLSARDILANLYDEGNFSELDAFAKSGENLSGVLTAFGYVNSNPVYAFAQDFSVLDGALTEVGAKKISKIYDMASQTGLPVIGFYDSYGANLNDGLKVLTSYGELLRKTSNLSGVVPQIAVVTGTCAGTSAIIAVSSDFVIMTKDSELYVAPNTSNDTAKDNLKNGTANFVEEDTASAIEKAKELVSRLPQNNLSPVPMFEFEASTTIFGTDAMTMAKAICDADSLLEISSEYGKSAYVALGSICGATVGIVATNKTEDKLTGCDCSKIARLVRTCDAYAIPVITIVDTEGFDATECSNAKGTVKQMAKLSSAYAEATTIKIAIVNKAYGSAFISLAGKGANADLVYATENAVISPMSPLSAVEFLYHDKLKGTDDLQKGREALVSEYIKTEASAQKAAEDMCVDGIVSTDSVRDTVISAIEIMAGKRETRLPKKHNNSPF